MGHLGDKADLTPSPLRVSGSHRGGLTGETNDVVRCYVFALTEQASVTLLLPRRNHCSPSNLLCQLVSSGGPDRQAAGGGNGAERNRTAVRNSGVDHLVGPKTDPFSMALPFPPLAANAGGQGRTFRGAARSPTASSAASTPLIPAAARPAASVNV